jgi:hypothetical protein
MREHYPLRRLSETRARTLREGDRFAPVCIPRQPHFAASRLFEAAARLRPASQTQQDRVERALVFPDLVAYRAAG